MPLKLKIEKIQKAIAENLSGRMINGVSLKPPTQMIEMSMIDDDLNGGGSQSFRSISKVSPRASIAVMNSGPNINNN